MSPPPALVQDMRLTEWLRNLLDGQYDGIKRKQIDIGRKLGGVSNSPIGNVLSGNQKIPLKHIMRWADVLELEGEHREVFIELAHLEHTSPWLRNEWLKMEKRLKTTQHELENLNERFALQSAKHAELLRKKDELIIGIIKEARRRDARFPDFGFDII